MTTSDVLAALARRWYALASGLVSSLLISGFVYTAPGVYHSSTDIYISPPRGVKQTQMGSFTAATIAMTGLVERRVNDGSGPQAVSPEVTLVDMGIFNGTMVSLPNSGGQWTYSFAEPRLRVSAAARTAAEAEVLREKAARRVERELRAIQSEDGIPQAQRYVSRRIPSAPQVTFHQGRRPTAAATAVLLGAGVTVYLTVLLDRRLRRREVARSRS